jgi:hypothetical protein
MRKGKGVSTLVCGCQECGALMVQDQKGIESACKCPACGNACDACLGTDSQIKKGEGLPLELLARYDEI